MKYHYIAMSGFRGYMPDFICVTNDYNGAVETLSTLFEFGKKKKSELKKNGWLEFEPVDYGAEYCQIIKCNCNDPKQHDSDYEEN